MDNGCEVLSLEMVTSDPRLLVFQNNWILTTSIWIKHSRSQLINAITYGLPFVQSLSNTVQSCSNHCGLWETQHLLHSALHPWPQLLHLPFRKRHPSILQNIKVTRRRVITITPRWWTWWSPTSQRTQTRLGYMTQTPFSLMLTGAETNFQLCFIHSINHKSILNFFFNW